ncbi:MAG: hypothetical protein ABIS01_02240, partial [Ferruginibacter sp.]
QLYNLISATKIHCSGTPANQKKSSKLYVVFYSLFCWLTALIRSSHYFIQHFNNFIRPVCLTQQGRYKSFAIANNKMDVLSSINKANERWHMIGQYDTPIYKTAFYKIKPSELFYPPKKNTSFTIKTMLRNTQGPWSTLRSQEETKL